MTEKREKLKIRLQLLEKTIEDSSVNLILKKIMKKQNLDKFTSDLKSFVETSETADIYQIENLLLPIKENLASHNNESHVLIHSINRMEQIIPSLCQHKSSKSEQQKKIIDKCRSSLSELSEAAEQCQEENINKELIKQVNDKFLAFSRSVEDSCHSLGIKSNGFKPQIIASKKNAEKSLSILLSMGDVIYLIESVLQALSEEKISKQKTKKTEKNQRKKKAIKTEENENDKTVPHHDFVEFFKKKEFNEVCKMREIPEHRARESEIAFMEERKKVLNFSYNSMKQTYMPCRRIEEEEKENQRLKELYRASLLTAEDFQILQQNNEELKQVIAELEDFFDKHQQEQEKQSSKQPEKIIIEDEGDIDETENIKQPKTPKKKQKK